ncbi:hypothetical protein [Thaumasiovibrio sp. DFM-14]|uniref:hypothetical protein n=1 Tax=Thaumasiovibrio sp. DFM-14 TaxID=3384792 RepID=UPI00399F87BE
MSYMKFASALFAACSSISVAASSLPEWVNVSGFASVAAAKSDNATPYYYTRDIGDEWCFDCDTTLGIQLDLYPTDWLHFSVQGVKRPSDHFRDPELEWAYVAVNPTDTFQLRAGRLRSPMFMYSQVVFVNQAYPWIRLPAEVYDTTAGFTRFEAIDALINVELSDQLFADIQPYIAFPSKINGNEVNQLKFDVDVKEVYGLRIDLEGVNWGLYVNYFKSRVDISTVERYAIPGLPPQIPPQQLAFAINTDTWSYGAKVDIDDWTLMFEATTAEGSSWGAYASAIYHYNDWSPYIVYGKRLPSDAEGVSVDKSDSLSLGLRYDIKPNLSIIGEWHYTRVPDIKYRGSFTHPPSFTGQPGLSDNSATIFSLGLSYSFSL